MTEQEAFAQQAKRQIEMKHQREMKEKDQGAKYQGRGTRARLNTAAEKHMFGGKYSK